MFLQASSDALTLATSEPMEEETKKGKTKKTGFREVYEWFGVGFVDDRSNVKEWVGSCPFCNHSNHFFVNQLSGAFDCKKCGTNGNQITFFQKIVDHAAEETTAAQWQALAEDRGLPAQAYQHCGVGFLEKNQSWLMPIYSDKGTVRDVRCWRLGGKMMSPPGASLQLAGLYTLAHPESNPTADNVRIWVCEGEHDWVAIQWLLREANSPDIAVGVPGAGTFKKEWVPWFQACSVIVCGDNDKSGDEMQLKWQEKILGIARRLQFLNWPAVRPDGYDLRDFVSDGRKTQHSAKTGIATLEQLFSDSPRLAPLGDDSDSQTPEKPESGALQPIAFDELVAIFKKHVKVSPEFEQALAVAAATCLSGAMPSDPIWVYLVGQAGVGKTLILNGFKSSKNVHYESTIKRTSLISGYDKGADNSLLPRLHDKTAIFKDGTELLAMPVDARNEVFGTLRGAFDGSYSHNFGNGLHRKYICHFNCLIGVTNAIRATAQDQLGERFLRFEMREKDEQLVSDKLWAAQDSIRAISKEHDRETEMVAAGTAFLSRKVPYDDMPKISDDNCQKLQSMSELVSILRASVMRNTRSEEMLYRPDPESPTRVCKQLTKLAIMLAFTLGLSEVNDYCIEICRRMSYDSCIDFNIDIVRMMYRLPLKGGISKADLAKAIRVDGATIDKRVTDLCQLEVLRKEEISKTNGLMALKSDVYFLETRIVNLWRGCL